MMASRKNGTLYIGVTDNIRRRVYEHRSDLIEGFTKKYHVHALVYFEQTSDISAAIQREKQIKKWRREWKIALIKRDNPEWRDLYENLL